MMMNTLIDRSPQMVKLVSRRVLVHLRGDPWSESWEKAMHPSLVLRMYRQYLTTLWTKGIEETDLILPNSRWLQRRVNQHLRSIDEGAYMSLAYCEWLFADKPKSME